MAGVMNADDLAAWAERVLPIKNTLQKEDAAIIEKAFVATLEQRTSGADPAAADTPAPVAENPPSNGSDTLQVTAAIEAASSPSSASPNATVPDADCADLAFGKTRRKRDRDHRAFVASKPCLVCGRRPADAHHLRFTQPRALGRKVSDEFTVPLCRIHHRSLHLRGDEAAWWQQVKVDPLEVAQRLWRESRSNPRRA
jgi:hypothetical protein